MPWDRTNARAERERFVHQFESGAITMTELCERFGVSRPTGYLWWKRYRESGVEGLCDRSRKPHHSPRATPPELEAIIVEARTQHPTWGPRMIRQRLLRKYPDRPWPAASTISRMLDRHGLIKRRKRPRRRVHHPGRPVVQSTQPNDTWTIDFKGDFKTRDGKRCFPLTMADHYSRYLLVCKTRESVIGLGVLPFVERAFHEYGLPRQMLSDGGPPFGSNGLARLSKFGVWLLKRGVQPILIEPARPDQNGRHERMHRTLGQVTRPPAGNHRAQQRRFNVFVQDFNHERPHDGLGGDTPAEHYCASPRTYDGKVIEPEYPSHWETRRVDASAKISWRSKPLRISKVLIKETVAFEPVDDGVHRLFYGDVLLGFFDERTWSITH